MQAVQFHNFSNEDFTWKWDGTTYTFKAGQTIFLEDFKAEHFAKHLVDREMNRAGIQTNDPRRGEFMSRCFPSAEAITPLEALQVNNGGDAEVAKDVVEEEFEDLSTEVKPKGKGKKK